MAAAFANANSIVVSSIDALKLPFIKRLAVGGDVVCMVQSVDTAVVSVSSLLPEVGSVVTLLDILAKADFGEHAIPRLVFLAAVAQNPVNPVPRINLSFQFIGVDAVAPAEDGEEAKEKPNASNPEFEILRPLDPHIRIRKPNDMPELLPYGTVNLQGVAEELKRHKKILVMCGAGISVAAGIPDFRTPKIGLYSNLEKYNLPSLKLTLGG